MSAFLWLCQHQKQRAHLAGCFTALSETQPCLPVPPWPCFLVPYLDPKHSAGLPMAAPHACSKQFTPILDHSMFFSEGRCHTKLSSSMDIPKCSSSWCTQVFSWQWVALGNPSALGVAASKHISFSTFPSHFFLYETEESHYLAHRHPFIYKTKSNAHTRKKRHLKTSCMAMLEDGPGIWVLLGQGRGRYLHLSLPRDAHSACPGWPQVPSDMSWTLPSDDQPGPLQCIQLQFKVETYQRAFSFFF